MEIGLAGMADRPFADAVVEIEQAGLVGDLGARLGGNQAARRRGGDRRLLIAGTLADEAAGADRAVLHVARCGALVRRRGGAASVRQPARRAPAWRASAFGAAGFGAAAAGAGFFASFSSPGLTGDGRCSRPRRWALPITALRLTPPSSSAIWLAVAPSCHIFFRRSMRSSVQDMS